MAKAVIFFTSGDPSSNYEQAKHKNKLPGPFLVSDACRFCTNHLFRGGHLLWSLSGLGGKGRSAGSRRVGWQTREVGKPGVVQSALGSLAQLENEPESS